jgi:hypothetical protein
MRGHATDARHGIPCRFDHLLETRIVREVVEQRETIEAHARVRMAQGQDELRRHDATGAPEHVELAVR